MEIFKYHDYLVNLVRRYYHNTAIDPEDAVQTVYLKWLSNNKTEVKNVKAYLSKSALNAASNLQYSRRRWVNSESILDFSEDTENRPQDETAFVNIYLSKLPTKRKRVVKLFLQGYKYNEIAKKLKIKRETVKWHLMKIRKEVTV